MRVRWIAIGCVMQGIALGDAMRWWQQSCSIPTDPWPIVAFVALGLIVEGWLGRRWFDEPTTR